MSSQWRGVISLKNGVMLHIAAKMSKLPHGLSTAKAGQVIIVRENDHYFVSRIVQEIKFVIKAQSK
jgi:hypothetical protein